MDTYARRYRQRMDHLLLKIGNFTEAGPMKIVAASDSPNTVKRFADYVCDGTADNVTIQQAIDSIPKDENGNYNGKVLCTAGNFALAGAIDVRPTGADLASDIRIGIYGEGTERTVFSLGENKNVSVIRSLVPIGATGRAYFISIGYLTISGNRTANTYGHGFLARDYSQAQEIEAITLTGSDPVSIQVTGHGYSTSDIVEILDVTDKAIELRDDDYRRVVVTKVDDDNFTLNGTDSSNFTSTGDATGYVQIAVGEAARDSYQHFDGYIDQVMAISIAEDGFRVEGAWGFKINNTITEYCNGNGLWMSGSQNYITNHFSAYNNYCGFKCLCSDGAFTNLHCYKNGTNAIYLGRELKGGSGNVFSNISATIWGTNGRSGAQKVSNSDQNGIELKKHATDNVFSSIYLVGAGTSESAYGVYCNSANNVFSGIRIRSQNKNPMYFDNYQYAYDNQVSGVRCDRGLNANEEIHNGTGQRTVVQEIGREYHIYFTSGSTKPSIGDVLSDATSGATGTVYDIVEISGAWGDGNQLGVFVLKGVSGTFSAGNNIDNDTTTDSNVATAGMDSIRTWPHIRYDEK